MDHCSLGLKRDHTQSIMPFLTGSYEITAGITHSIHDIMHVMTQNSNNKISMQSRVEHTSLGTKYPGGVCDPILDVHNV